jgi:hypothetical protein
MNGTTKCTGFNRPRTRLVFPFRAAILYTNRIFPLKSSKSLACLNPDLSVVSSGTRGAATVMTDTIARLSLESSSQLLSRSALNMTTEGENVPATDPGPRFGQG